jgi:Ran GTPase-activating protein (RanGAP) involved in mRNA processing and transport
LISNSLLLNTTLHSLHLGSNAIGSCTGPLANALQTNATLRSLSLGNNALGAEGEIILAQALAANTTLLKLDLASAR